jgi:AraC-like DNA-binding protein
MQVRPLHLRRLLLARKGDLTAVAYEVGYKSPNQQQGHTTVTSVVAIEDVVRLRGRSGCRFAMKAGCASRWRMSETGKAGSCKPAVAHLALFTLARYADPSFS